MNKQIDTVRLEKAAHIGQALSEASRIKLLMWLQEGERCVTEIAELEGANINTISARLQVLMGADLVSRRREGKRMLYRLADQHVVELVDNLLRHSVEDHFTHHSHEEEEKS